MKETVQSFKRRVLAYHRMYGRHDLLWRNTTDSYAILVSEVMLQQTQVDRVRPYFERWMRRFPDVAALARTPLSGVLKEWQGLGYNRRGKMLRECAKEICARHNGMVPRKREALISLPAIGPYTAGAIRTFAFNEPEVFIETNIRAVLIHHFFPRSKQVPDAKLIPILQKAIKNEKNPREWYWALMDYGVLIKKKHPNPSRRSKHHTKQSPFEGSLRQMRGVILRKLLVGPISHTALARFDAERTYHIEKALRAMQVEGLIEKKGTHWQLVNE